MGFAAWDGCRGGSYRSLNESADYTYVLGVYHHASKSQQLISQADTRILASLTSACYSILLQSVLGIVVVMNETIVLGYSPTERVKKPNQTVVTVNYLLTFLVLLILSHFSPDNQNDAICLRGHEVTYREQTSVGISS